MNTPAGGIKYRETMIKKFGSEEAWKQRMREVGSRGGKNGTGHTFAHGKVDPAESGKIGGRISRRSRKSE
jgi:general stress protein YciG